MGFSKGFTVLELVVVLVLLGALAAVGGARFFDLPSYASRGWADQLVVTAGYARAQAIANRSARVRWVLTAGGQRAELSADCTAVIATPLANVTGNGDLTLSAPMGVSLAVAGQALPFTICFDSLGRPRDISSPAGALLTTVTTLQVVAGTNTTTLYLEPQTGFLHP